MMWAHRSVGGARGGARRRAGLGLVVGSVLLALGVGLAACGPQGAAPAARSGSAPAASPGASQGAPGAAAVAPASAPAAVPALPRVRSAYTSESASEIVLWVADEAGLFKQHGLDVEVQRIAGGSSKAVQVMLAGELDVAQVGGTAVVDANLAGADLVSIATVIPVLGMSAYAMQEIRRVEDLRGKAVGVTRAGTISDFGMRMGITRGGLRPDVDVQILQTGGVVETMAAIASNNAVAGIVLPPFDVQARKLGLHELMDLAALGLEFQHNGLTVQRQYLAKNEELLGRFVRAYTEAVARTRQDKALAKQAISKHSKTEDDEALESGYQAYGVKYLARVPLPTPGQFQSILDFVAEREPRARELTAARLIDDRFVRALEQEGFIDRLYR